MFRKLLDPFNLLHLDDNNERNSRLAKHNDDTILTERNDRKISIGLTESVLGTTSLGLGILFPPTLLFTAPMMLASSSIKRATSNQDHFDELCKELDFLSDDEKEDKYDQICRQWKEEYMPPSQEEQDQFDICLKNLVNSIAPPDYNILFSDNPYTKCVKEDLGQFAYDFCQHCELKKQGQTNVKFNTDAVSIGCALEQYSHEYLKNTIDEYLKKSMDKENIKKLSQKYDGKPKTSVLLSKTQEQYKFGVFCYAISDGIYLDLLPKEWEGVKTAYSAVVETRNKAAHGTKYFISEKEIFIMLKNALYIIDTLPILLSQLTY